jgi:hypothetical protein
MSKRWMLGFAAVLCTLGPAACAGSVDDTTGSSAGGRSASSTASSSSTGGADAGKEDGGGAHDAGGDAADAADEDGTPVRVACTSNFGNALSAAFGRLDGYLVSIVPMGTSACNGDGSHVHLQVKVHDEVYDVAVNDGTLYDEKDMALPDGPWSEGWHTGIALDYVKSFGLHAGNFTSATPAAVVAKIESELATANHISVFATGYGPTGIHDVHRKGYGEDGAIVIDPLSPTPHILTFCFSTDSF